MSQTKKCSKSHSLTDECKLELVKKLRNETGSGMMDCKKALYESNWEIDDAKSWLNQFRKNIWYNVLLK